MDFFKIIGWIAAVGTVIMYMPQTLRVLKTKDVSSLSKIGYPIISLGGTLLTMYIPLVTNDYQGWISNFLVGFLMMPIFYYLFFKDNKKIFFGAVLWIIGAQITSIIFKFVMGPIENKTIKLIIEYTFSIIAGGTIGLGLLPEAIKIWKTKRVGSYSIVSGMLISFICTLWAIYWTSIAIGNWGTSEFVPTLVTATFSYVGLCVQTPILIVGFKTRKNIKG